MRCEGGGKWTEEGPAGAPVYCLALVLPESPPLRRCEQTQLVSVTEGHRDLGTHRARSRHALESTVARRGDFQDRVASVLVPCILLEVPCECFLTPELCISFPHTAPTSW